MEFFNKMFGKKEKTEQNGDDVPIIYLCHDVNRVEYYAKNLQDYIFIEILTDCSIDI